MREISVSMDVFARIWALRAQGEDSEDEILRRVLLRADGQIAGGLEPVPMADGGRHGFYDARFSVTFPEGFEISRIFQKQTIRAIATCGSWRLMPSGKKYASLNELSRAIGAGVENAWRNWFYFDQAGERRPVADLRDPKLVHKKSLETIGGRKRLGTGAQVEDDVSKTRWVDDVARALREMNGLAPLSQIYQRVKSIRQSAGRSVPESLEATVRRTLEDHSSDSDNYREGPDLFRMPQGRGAGIWALR